MVSWKRCTLVVVPVLASLLACEPFRTARHGTAPTFAEGASASPLILLGVENVPHSRLESVKKTISLFARPGLCLLGRNNLKWRDVEPEPPRQGVHDYAFDALDREFRVYAESGLQLQVTFLCRSSWATVVADSKLPSEIAGSPPKDEHWDDFAKVVAELVERYDGDGKGDAFAAKQPLIRILTIQEEVEFGANWTANGGTPENYGRVLATACEAAKRTDPSILVARAGTSAGTLFDLAPTDEEFASQAARDPTAQRALDFLVASLEKPVDYDLFSLHVNRSWTGLLPFARWVRGRMKRAGYERPLTIDDAATIDAVRPGEPFLSEESKEVLKLTPGPALLSHQVAHTVKLVSLAASAQVHSLLLTSYADVPSSPFAQIRHGGLLDSAKYLQSGDALGAAKPAYFALVELAKRVASATSARSVAPPDGPAEIVRFSQGESAFHVAWSRSGAATIELEVGRSPARVLWFGVPESGGTFKQTTQDAANGRISLAVTTDPVLVE